MRHDAGERGVEAAPGDLLDAVDRYFDAAPRSGALSEEVGPFTMFVSKTAWTYAARPRVGLDCPIVADDIARLGARCDALGLKLSLEWVHEVTPSLAAAAREAGLTVEPHALFTVAPGDLQPARAPVGARVDLLGPEDARVVAARAVADEAFAAGGTAIGVTGPRERDARIRQIGVEMRHHLAARAAAALTITAVAVDPVDGVVATGSLQPVGATAEIVAVATLPSHRRRGLAAAVTSALVCEADARGVELVVLAAQSDEVGRVYERVGFHRVGTQVAASRPRDALTRPT
jgi:GNAT superfamily N-acetyltransferase